MADAGVTVIPSEASRWKFIGVGHMIDSWKKAWSSTRSSSPNYLLVLVVLSKLAIDAERKSHISWYVSKVSLSVLFLIVNWQCELESAWRNSESLSGYFISPKTFLSSLNGIVSRTAAVAPKQPLTGQISPKIFAKSEHECYSQGTRSWPTYVSVGPPPPSSSFSVPHISTTKRTRDLLTLRLTSTTSEGTENQQRSIPVIQSLAFLSW